LADFLADSSRLILASLICLFLTACCFQTVAVMVCALERKRPALTASASMLCQSMGILIALFGFGSWDRDLVFVALPLILLRAMTMPKEQGPLARTLEIPLLVCGLVGMGVVGVYYGPGLA
jgi:hypothetical protein